jgi:hypothetical protein
MSVFANYSESNLPHCIAMLRALADFCPSGWRLCHALSNSTILTSASPNPWENIRRKLLSPARCDLAHGIVRDFPEFWWAAKFFYAEQLFQSRFM